jgi:hypothetical protein
MTIGRIPWSCVRAFARKVYGMTEVEMLDGFWILMSTLDLAFGEWMSEEHDKARRQREASQKAQASQVGTRSRSRRFYSR